MKDKKKWQEIVKLFLPPIVSSILATLLEAIIKKLT